MTKEDIDASEAPLIEHLMELRNRLIYCVIGFVAAFAASFFFSSDILHYLVLPFKWGTGEDVSLISIKLLGVFLVKLKIGFFGGKTISAQEIEALSKLPSKEELYAKLLGAMQGVATGLVRTIKGVPQKLATALKEIEKAKQV